MQTRVRENEKLKEIRISVKRDFEFEAAKMLLQHIEKLVSEHDTWQDEG